MIKILRYEPCNIGSKLATLDISIDIEGVALIIRNLAHLKKGEREWFNFPTFQRIEGGYSPKKTYPRVIEYENPETNQALLASLHEAVKAYHIEHSTLTEPTQYTIPEEVSVNDESIPF